MTQMAVPTRTGLLPSLLSIISMLLLAAIGVALAWQVISRSLADYLAGFEPRWALQLSPGNSAALVALAQGKLSQTSDEDISSGSDNASGSDASSGGDVPPLSPQAQAASDAIRARGVPLPMVAPDIPDPTKAEVRQLAQAALRNDPLDPSALRILGQVADSDERTTDFMRTAAARSLHETLALYWLVQKSFLDGNFAKTTAYADTLLRSQPQLSRAAVPILARIAETKDGLDHIKSLLRTNPPWHLLFFQPFITSTSDTHLPLSLMLDLQERGIPPVKTDLKFYINYLMKNKLYSFAYYTWLQFLPPEQLRNLGLLFNGNFGLDPSGLPFDWTITYNNGVEIDIVNDPDRPDHRELYWEFTEGRVDTNGVEQVVTLAPGTYTLRGLEKGGIQARRGLVWRVACYSNNARTLAKGEPLIGSVPDWKEFSIDFTVPARNCEAQRVWLSVDAVSDSDRLVSGSAWFADIGLSAKTGE